MPFNGLLSSRRNVNLTSQLAQWSIEDGSGICFGSSTIFGLPNGAWRMPDVAWIKREKWDNLTEQEKDSFTPFCPDFVVEICSPSDDLEELYLKMAEYVLNGV